DDPSEPDTPSDDPSSDEPSEPGEPVGPVLRQGWYQAGNNWQYYKNGKALTGWQNDIPGWSGRWFYFDLTTTYAKSGWVSDILGWEGQWFYFDAISGTCVMQTSWLQIGNEFYYLNESGIMQTGWQFIVWSGGTDWFYFDVNGLMLKNTTTPDGYYVDENGRWVS
ncbi:MAG: hypothetical protein Q4B14_06885, partial [Clostridia bacterium]|nr:hypothetical protein [Clostridia bacterium]